MNDQAIHRLYRHFQELPVGMRTLFTGALLVLGLGYLFCRAADTIADTRLLPAAERLDEHRLAEPREPLQQHVPARQQRDRHQVEEILLTEEHRVERVA